MKKRALVLLFTLCTAGYALAQRTISGVVSDQAGEPLIGASVLVKGTNTGTVTDIDGAYALEVASDGSVTLVFSYTGFGTKEVETGNSSTLDITLDEGVTLTEAVVTALGIEREEKALGYAVQELSGEELSNAREPNIINSLQGRVAGVQIQGSPSTLGGSSRITIRGSNSFLGNNQPLFVVDGFPIDNSNFASNSQQRGFGGGAYDYGNTAQDIDPESIESMTVLKGAAATALYGQRGANGVILITTKDGSGQRGIGVEVNSSFAADRVANLIPHQQVYGGGALNTGTTHGFNEVVQDGETYLYPAYSKDGSWGPKYDPNRQVRHWDSWDPGNPETYKQTRPWVAPNAGYEDFFQIGQTWTNSVALQGSNDRGGFRFGYTNLSQTGTMPNGKLGRNTFNLNASYNLSDRVSVRVFGNYVNTTAENRNVTGYNNGNPMQAFTQWWQTQLDMDRMQDIYRADGTQQTWNPIGPIKDANDNLLSFNTRPNFFDNPYWVREEYLQEDVRNRFFGNAEVTINLLPGLDLSGRGGTDFYQFSVREGIPIQSVETSYYGETERRFQETNLETRLTYNRDWGKFSLNAMVGANRMRQITRRSTMESSGGLALEGFFNISNSAGPPVASTFESERGINSVFGLASLGYGGWVFVDITARNDWSSTLPKGDNSYFYPSASLSLVLSELPGLGDIPALSFAKLRASYAEVGSDADPYSLIDVFAPQTPNFAGNPRYAVPNAKNNPNLKPELTSEYEIGLDLRFFQRRIGVDVAYFDRTTKNQIFTVPSSAATGYTSRILNAGEMRNWGVEMQLTATPVLTNDFRWDVGINAFRQFNEVVQLTEGVEAINQGGTWAADLRVAEGFPYMALFGQNYVFDDNGERLVDDQGNYQFTPERQFLGSAIADWTGGFSTNFSYKGLFASALFDFQVGGIIHSTSLQWAKYSGMHPETVAFNGESDTRANGMVLPGVKADGTPNDIPVDPQTYYQTFWNRAAPNVFDASFLKLREVRIGYRVPNRMLGNAPFRDIVISLYGRNLAILAADLPYLDPQIITGAGNVQGLENAQVPSTQTFGVNLQFKL